MLVFKCLPGVCEYLFIEKFLDSLHWLHGQRKVCQVFLLMFLWVIFRLIMCYKIFLCLLWAAGSDGSGFRLSGSIPLLSLLMCLFLFVGSVVVNKIPSFFAFFEVSLSYNHRPIRVVCVTSSRLTMHRTSRAWHWFTDRSVDSMTSFSLSRAASAASVAAADIICYWILRVVSQGLSRSTDWRYNTHSPVLC